MNDFTFLFRTIHYTKYIYALQVWLRSLYSWLNIPLQRYCLNSYHTFKEIVSGVIIVENAETAIDFCLVVATGPAGHLASSPFRKFPQFGNMLEL